MGEHAAESVERAAPRRVVATRKRIILGLAVLGVSAYAIWSLLIPASRCLSLDCVQHRGGYTGTEALSEFNDVWQQRQNASRWSLPWTAARTDGLRRVGGDWSRQCMRVRVYELPQSAFADEVPFLWQEYSSCYRIDGAFPFRDEWRLFPATEEEQLAWTREIAATDETWIRLMESGSFYHDNPNSDLS